MKTILPEKISTIKEAKDFLTELHKNGESFHPEDDANDLVGDPFTKEEGDKLNQLMADIYNLPGNDGFHDGRILFCPCEHLLSLDHDYMRNFGADENEYFKDAAREETMYLGFKLVTCKKEDADSTYIYKDGKMISSENSWKETDSLTRAKIKIDKVLLA
jgi:hypothetical protein